MSAHDVYLDCVHTSEPDLAIVGTVLTPERVAETRLYNATRGADGAEFLARRRAEALAAKGSHSAQGRVNWYKYLIGESYAQPPSDEWADRMLEAAKQRWGATEFSRVKMEATR